MVEEIVSLKPLRQYYSGCYDLFVLPQHTRHSPVLRDFEFTFSQE